VSTQLKSQYGRNFEIRNLRRMMQLPAIHRTGDYFTVVTTTKLVAFRGIITVEKPGRKAVLCRYLKWLDKYEKKEIVIVFDMNLLYFPLFMVNVHII
jgi:hypothetical protein